MEELLKTCSWTVERELLGSSDRARSRFLLLGEPLFNVIQTEVEPLTGNQPVPLNVHDLPTTLMVEGPDARLVLV
jgi:hypothetical protein